MPDLIKKILLGSIGLALKAWDEVEDLVKEFIKEGKMSEKEGRQFLKDLKNKRGNWINKRENNIINFYGSNNYKIDDKIYSIKESQVTDETDIINLSIIQIIYWTIKTHIIYTALA